MLLVNLNGQLHRAQKATELEASISVMDRGFLYGDSIYEVVRVVKGHPLFLEDHLMRLEQSAKLGQIDLTLSRDELRSHILSTLESYSTSNSDQELYVRIIITRGIGKIGFGKECVETPNQWMILIKPHKPLTQAHLQKGISLAVVDRIRNDQRALDPAMKSGNYLNNILALLEARERGNEDALLCNQEGFVTEGTTFNVFYIRRGIVVTPPLKIGMLDGITRRNVLQTAKDLGLAVRVTPFHKERLYTADEIFITSTLRDVFPVTQVDQRKKKVGPLTLKINEAFRMKAGLNA